VVAGAALGIATGRFVSARSEHANVHHLSVTFQPLDHGGMLQFTLDPNTFNGASN
jgi:hypothetical protein